jgi:hypothetical protein
MNAPRLHLLATLLLIAASSATHAGMAIRQQSTRQPSADQTTKESPPPQPLPFSHKQHAALALPCKFCHSNSEPGTLMGVPSTDVCMTCHESVATGRPAIRELARFARSQRPIPWVRVYALPAFVYWSHRTHLDADVHCEPCHGDVLQMERMTLATKVTTMAGCVDCHKHSKAGTGCAACHEPNLSWRPRTRASLFALTAETQFSNVPPIDTHLASL